jgi:benzaldehyde dehydrogenase (NAD)
VEDPNVRMISFTGSTATGRIVGETAGRGLKRTVLELGGNSPLVVLEDADIEAASSAGAWGSFLHQGQICLSVSRHLVHESILEEYTAALVERAERLPVGNPATEEVALGPLINEKQLARVRRIVDESVAQGAMVLAGGTNDGLFFKPTVLGDVTTTMPAFVEEIFGPVAPVLAFRDDEHAVELANATDYGLVAAVQSGSPERAAAIADRLRAGMVHVNDSTINEEPPAPFGGTRSSSNGGHFGGVANLELWTEWQWLTGRDKAVPFPF